MGSRGRRRGAALASLQITECTSSGALSHRGADADDGEGGRGGDRLEEVAITGTAGDTTIQADGFFVLIGAAPLTATITDWLRCDDRGYILTGRDLLQAPDKTGWPLERDPFHLESSQPGVFVAGDVRHGSVKRVASPVGEGAMAVSLVHSYLATV